MSDCIINEPNEPPFGGKGMTHDERHATHERWCDKGRATPDKQLNELYENGKQCGGCAFYIELTSDLGMDWGVCANVDSQYDGFSVFEHFVCKQYTHRPEDPDPSTLINM